MSDGFEQMVDASLAFFPKLAQNNSKDWFEKNKAAYVHDIRKPAELLAGLIAEDLARVTGRGYTSKVFRIYRDVRFSKDKTPYNTHLHVMWAPVSGAALDPVWYFGLSAEYFLLGTGVMGLKGADLTAYRALVDAHGDDLKAAMASSSDLQLSTWGQVPLKRVPKPYDVDHPHEDLLRRKSFAVHVPIPSGWRNAGLVAEMNAQIARLLPVDAIFARNS